MALVSDDHLWQIIAVGSSALAGIAIRRAVKSGWRRVRGSEPPTNPAAADVDWVDAIAFTAMTSVAVGLTRVIARRAAAAGWTKRRGTRPV